MPNLPDELHSSTTAWIVLKRIERNVTVALHMAVSYAKQPRDR